MATTSTQSGTPSFVTTDALGHWTGHVVKRAATEAINYSERKAREVIMEVNAQRQAVEDVRANHRNFNRMMTLLGALLIGLVVTWLLQHPATLASIGVGPKTCKMLAPYSFVITVMMDSTLAAYALIRHY